MSFTDIIEASPPSPVALRSILADATGSIEARACELAMLTRTELDRRMLSVRIAVQCASEGLRPVPTSARLDFWLCNAEYTRRGIPPVFRGLPDLNDDNADQIGDMFAIDLHWVATRSPNQVILFKRWRGILKPSTFHSTADYISRAYPRNAMHWFCKGLNLTEAQQRELHTIKRDGIRREVRRLIDGQKAARIKLSTAYHARDSRYKTADHKATIDRRLAVWFCGSLADWKPQPTADLFHAYTGEIITRQLAAKIIAQVHRDLPESKPKPARRRQKSQLCQ